MIAVVNPPNPLETVSNKDTMGGFGQLYPAGAPSRMPPLDIPHAAAVLRQRSIPMEVVECLGSGLDQDQFISRIEQLQPDIIAVRTSLPTFDWDMGVVTRAQECTGASIILFGPCMSYLHGEALQHDAIDGILLGEPELALAEIAVRGVAAHHPHLVTRGDRSGATTQAAVVEDLDSLPFAAWDLMPYTAYSGAELMRDITPFVTMQTSRGCPHGCLYCPYPVTQGRRLRYHSVQRVVEEMRWLQDRLGVRAVLFRDPEFALNRERIVTLCEAMVSHDIKIAWRCETRIENLDPELVRLMSRAGCIGLNMGVESFDEEVLRSLRRRHVSHERAQAVIAEARKAGIGTFCFFILGLPGETIRSSLDTISSALALGCDHLQFTTATPYPGTRLYDWAVERGYLEDQSRALLTGYDAVMQNGHLSSRDISDLQNLAGSRWALTLMGQRRTGYGFMDICRAWKLGMSINMQQRRLLKRSRTLGE